MERNFYNEEFESFLKDKADQHRLYPSEKVWKNIHRQLHPRREWPYIIGALLLISLSVASKFYFTEEQKSGKLTAVEYSLTSELPESKGEITRQMPIAVPDARQIDQHSTTATLTTRHVSKNQGEVSLRLSQANQSIEMATYYIPELSRLIESSGDNDVSNPRKSFSSGIPITKQMNLSLSNPELLLNTFQFPAADTKTIIYNTNVQQSGSNATVGIKKPGVDRWDWQLYFTPTVSYRRLEGSGTKGNYTIGATNPGIVEDVSKAVSHKPSIGMELGTAMLFNINKNLRVKAGFQFNYSQYLIDAYSYVPEIAPYGANRAGWRFDTINVLSYYRNYDGFSKTGLRNERLMVSIPIGVEWSVVGNERVKFNIGATIQPTYNLSDRAYLVSTNLKNYAEEPSLYRRWNVNSALETFVSINTGTVRWAIGPQFRYQLLSSYKNNYPIQEYLVDFGFKVGLNKTIK